MELFVEGRAYVLPYLQEVVDQELLQRLQYCVELREAILVDSAPLMISRHMQKQEEAVLFEVPVECSGTLGVLHVAQDEAGEAVHPLTVANVLFDVSIGIEHVEEGVASILVALLEVTVFEATAADVGPDLIRDFGGTHVAVVLVNFLRSGGLLSSTLVELLQALLLQDIQVAEKWPDECPNVQLIFELLRDRQAEVYSLLELLQVKYLLALFY